MPYQSLIPILAYVLFGYLLRASGLVRAELATTLFRFIFIGTLPALVFTSIALAPLDRSSALLPAAGFLTNACCAAAAFAYAAWKQIDRGRAGALILCSSVINMMIMFPFVLAFFGPGGLTVAILYDTGNAIFVATAAQLFALSYGSRSAARRLASVSALLKSPIFIGLVLALVVNLNGIDVPELVYDTTRPLGQTTIPLVLMAVGISMKRVSRRGSLPLVTVATRMGVGLVSGIVLAIAFGFDGATASIVVVSAAAPIGAGAVSLVALGRFDVEQAAAALSLSLLLGLFSIPGLLSVAVFAGRS